MQIEKCGYSENESKTSTNEKSVIYSWWIAGDLFDLETEQERQLAERGKKKDI